MVRLDVSGSRVVDLDVLRIWQGCVVELDVGIVIMYYIMPVNIKSVGLGAN